MFRTEIRDDFSILRWVAQHAIAWLAPPILAAIVLSPIEVAVRRPLGAIGDFVLGILVVLSIGFWIGRILCRVFASDVRTGLLVWVIPTSLLAIDIVWSAIFSSLSAVIKSFTGSGPGGLGEVLLGYPALGSIGYALGMLAGTRAGRRAAIEMTQVL